MPVYSFQAKALGGKVVKGDIDAASDVEARVKLRAQQLIPVKVVPKGAKAKSNAKSGGKVTPKDLQIFTRQFSTLINSGIPVVQSLEILGNSSSSPALKAAVLGTKEDLEKGKRLAESMAQYPKVFDRLYINLTKAGEEGGVLDTILNRLAIYIEKSVKIQGKIKGAMWYPAAILAVAVLVISAIMVFVIPKMEELFASGGQELPFLTQVVIDMSRFMISKWYLLVGGAIGAGYAFSAWKTSESGQKQWDQFLIGVPVFGSLVQKGAIAKFSRTLSTMLSCGVGIIESLEIAASVSGNIVIENSLREAKESISQGRTIVTPLHKNKYIPDMVVQMIGVGEQTGALDTMLGKIADFYEDEVDAAVSALTSVLEPLMMVFLGGIIAVLVIAMYLPIFNLAAGFG